MNDMPGRFNSAYGAPPAEIAPFFEQQGLITTTLISTEGIAVAHQDALMRIRESDPDLFQSAFEIILETAADPSILGLGNHLLFIGRTPA